MPNVIKTKCGEIRGTTCQWEGVTAYKGIRYATAKRWMYPEIVTHWDGVYDATEYGSILNITNVNFEQLYNRIEEIKDTFYDDIDSSFEVTDENENYNVYVNI